MLTAFRNAEPITKLIAWYVNAGSRLLNELLEDRETDLAEPRAEFDRQREALSAALVKAGERALAYEVQTRFDRMHGTEDLRSQWSNWGHELKRWDFVRTDRTPQVSHGDGWIGPMNATAFGLIYDGGKASAKTYTRRLGEWVKLGNAEPAGRGLWKVKWAALTETQRTRATMNGHK